MVAVARFTVRALGRAQRRNAGHSIAAPGRRGRGWFIDGDIHGCAAAGGEVRCDAYLKDANQSELGVKRRDRGVGVEVKGLVAVLDSDCFVVPFPGPIEMWGEWISGGPDVAKAPQIVVGKRRWLRTVDTRGAVVSEVTGAHQAQGCTVEYTEVSVEEQYPWVTLGFEAFGPIGSLADNLRGGAASLASRTLPHVGAGWRASYPVWLQQWAA